MMAATRNAREPSMSTDMGALPAEAAQRSLGQFALRFRVSGVLAF